MTRRKVIITIVVTLHVHIFRPVARGGDRGDTSPPNGIGSKTKQQKWRKKILIRKKIILEQFQILIIKFLFILGFW